MVRGIPWDNLPSRYEPDRNVVKKVDTPQSTTEIVPHTFDFKRDVPDIGRRIAFGAIVSEPSEFSMICTS